MGRHRVYIDEELYQEVKQFAKDRWLLFKERAPDGKKLYLDFPASLNRYIKLKIRGGI